MAEHDQRLAVPFGFGRSLLVAGQVQRRAMRKKIARRYLDRAPPASTPSWASPPVPSSARPGPRAAAPACALTAVPAAPTRDSPGA
jgi:hypothetical protein